MPPSVGPTPARPERGPAGRKDGASYNRLRMLLELVVENYAVIDRLRVHFHSGLNLLTGETGSGKSIVVDALGLLLGGRASSETIRTGETRARVAGIFDVRENGAIRQLLEPAGLETEDGELLIEREISAGGKSRAFVGSRPVAVALLRGLAPFLADIHGQHDQQLLFSPDAQRDMLDAFAGNAGLLERAGALYRAWRAAAAELEELERSEQEKLRLLDLWTFQRKEIESAGLAAEEDAALRNERRVLQNVQRLEEAAATAYAAVYDGPESALSLARTAAKRLDELCRIDASLEGLREHLKAADLGLQEVSYGLRDYLSRLEANPARLEEIETRLAAIDRLKRKYGQTIPEILAFAEEVRQQIAAVEHAGERMEELRKEQVRRPASSRSWPPISPRGAPGRAASSKNAWRRNWRNSPWSAPCSAWNGPGRVVRARRRPRRVPGLAQPGRRAARRWTRWLPVARSRAFALALKTCLAGPKTGCCPHPGFRRSGRRGGRQRRRGRGPAIEETGCRQPGACA